MQSRTFFTCIAFSIAAYSVASSQDTRQVVEPHYPKVCTVLHARLLAQHGELALSDEEAIHTLRVRKRLRCE